MLGLFRRDPLKKLRAEHLRLLEQARDLQRNGDIVGFAKMSERAEEVARRIDEAQTHQEPPPDRRDER